MIKKAIKSILIITTFISSLAVQVNSETLEKSFDIQGHRGARGLLPENSIPAFIKALDLGVTTLELDVVISKDKQLVVSHEPYFSSEICTMPNGKAVSKDKEKSLNIYEMNYRQVKRYDCGKRGHKKRFPEQQAIETYKPLLDEVIEKAEKHIKDKNLKEVFYNIETKTEDGGDNIFQPNPKIFVELLYNKLKELNLLDRVTIQSFDVRTLQELKKIDTKVKTVLLVENLMSFEDNIKKLGFTPDVYSPYYMLVNSDLIKKAHDKNVKIIPWTVNTLEEMKKLKDLGVDGIITDYPNLGVKLINSDKL